MDKIGKDICISEDAFAAALEEADIYCTKLCGNYPLCGRARGCLEAGSEHERSVNQERQMIL